MNQFPIVLLPRAIRQIQSELPSIPFPKRPEPPDKPIPPAPLPPAPKQVERDVITAASLFSGIIAFVIVVLAFLQSINTGIGALLLSGLGVAGTIWITRQQQIRSYPQRLEQHRLLVARYDKSELRYQREKREYPGRQRQYLLKLQEYNQECDRLEKKYRSPSVIARYRCERCLEILKQTVSYDGTNGNSKEGWSEKKLVQALNQYFPNKIYTKLKLTIPDYHHPYCPDIAYIDPATKLHIDIEVDEPYVYKSGEPTHYIDNERDDRRNEFFLKKKWIVIRFSEEQVVCATESCCKVVASVISDITGNQKILTVFSNVPDLEPMPQWTYEKALAMSNSNARKQYIR